MSVKIMGRIWELDLPHAQAWVLMAMADHADHDGGNVYPSMGLIAWKTGYSERQVQRVVADLVKAGILIKEERPGYTTLYQIDLSPAKLKEPREVTKRHPRQNVTPDKTAPRVRQNVTPTPDIAMSPESSREPSLNRQGGNAPAIASAAPAPEPKAEQKATGAAKATRLAVDSLPDDWRTYCATERPDLDPLAVFVDFRDYWIALPGQKATKTNWTATWQTWVRRTDLGRNPHLAAKSAQAVGGESIKLGQAQINWMRQHGYNDLRIRIQQNGNYATPAQMRELRQKGMQV